MHKAVDYKGCVEVLSKVLADKLNPSIHNVRLYIDAQVRAVGNECHTEFAYASGGYCRRAISVYGGLLGRGHHPVLAGKGMKCPNGIGQMQWGEWDKEKVRASVNRACP